MAYDYIERRALRTLFFAFIFLVVAMLLSISTLLFSNPPELLYYLIMASACVGVLLGFFLN